MEKLRVRVYQVTRMKTRRVMINQRRKKKKNIPMDMIQMKTTTKATMKALVQAQVAKTSRVMNKRMTPIPAMKEEEEVTAPKGNRKQSRGRKARVIRNITRMPDQKRQLEGMVLSLCNKNPPRGLQQEQDPYWILLLLTEPGHHADLPL